MATLLADPPAATSGQQSPPAPDGAATAAAAQAGPQRACAGCGAALTDGQDWCLQCGTTAPNGLAATAPGWRSAAAVLAALAILIAAAATAGYAALTKSSGSHRAVNPALARLGTAPAPAPIAPGATAPVTPATPRAAVPAIPKLGGPAVKPARPLTPLVKLSKIPAVTSVPSTPPASAPSVSTPTTTTAPTATTPTTSSGEESSAPAEKGPPAITLDTNAASTYDPLGLPASSFGDPSLAIDGEPATGWSARVDPTTAPKMAAGLALDLKSAQRLSALAITTSTPGMTVQVYATAARSLPATIADPAWVKASKALVVKKRHLRFALEHSTTAFRFVAVWISKVPATSVGTAKAPGHVSINELELFPPGK